MSNLEVGIVGLPNVGKSTLFNAITKAGAEAANFPFCTIEPNVGVVAVPDPRLKVLHELYNSKKTTPASVRFVDIAGLVKGASKGEGLGNKFLEHIRQVDAVAHVVRCFVDPNITHVEGGIDPLRDIDIIQTELCLADLEIVEKRIMKLAKIAKSGNKEAKVEDEILRRIKAALDEGTPARQVDLSEDDLELIKEMNLLTLKPTLYVTNVAEDEVATAYDENPYVQQVKEYAAKEGAEVVAISAKVESEIAELDEEEAKAFLEGDYDAPWLDPDNPCAGRLTEPEPVTHMLAVLAGRTAEALAIEQLQLAIHHLQIIHDQFDDQRAVMDEESIDALRLADELLPDDSGRAAGQQCRPQHRVLVDMPARTANSSSVQPRAVRATLSRAPT